MAKDTNSGFDLRITYLINVKFPAPEWQLKISFTTFVVNV